MSEFNQTSEPPTRAEVEKQIANLQNFIFNFLEKGKLEEEIDPRVEFWQTTVRNLRWGATAGIIRWEEYDSLIANLIAIKEWLSNHDALTGLLNRNGYEESIEQQLAAVERYGHALSVVMIDLKDFKTLNLRYGRPQADKALDIFAGFLKENLRSADIVARWGEVARWGGDEFMIIMPHTDELGAKVALRRLLKEKPKWNEISLEFDCGIASYNKESLRSKEQLVEAASKSCDRAKTLPPGSTPIVLASELQEG